MSKEAFFKYRKLTDYEKVLFLEKQVLELINLNKKTLREKGFLQSEVQELIHTDKSLSAVISLREENKNLREDRNKWKMMYEKELLKNHKS